MWDTLTHSTDELCLVLIRFLQSTTRLSHVLAAPAACGGVAELFIRAVSGRSVNLFLTSRFSTAETRYTFRISISIARDSSHMGVGSFSIPETAYIAPPSATSRAAPRAMRSRTSDRSSRPSSSASSPQSPLLHATCPMTWFYHLRMALVFQFSRSSDKLLAARSRARPSTHFTLSRPIS